MTARIRRTPYGHLACILLRSAVVSSPVFRKTRPLKSPVKGRQTRHPRRSVLHGMRASARPSGRLLLRTEAVAQMLASPYPRKGGRNAPNRAGREGVVPSERAFGKPPYHCCPTTIDAPVRGAVCATASTRCRRRLTLDRRSHRYRKCGKQLRRRRGPDPCHAVPVRDCMRATVVANRPHVATGWRPSSAATGASTSPRVSDRRAWTTLGSTILCAGRAAQAH
jgi:hypothetical protein